MKADHGPPDDLTREDLWSIIIGQRNETADLRKKLEDLLRDSKRSKAPFSKGTRVTNPKKPGRKPKQGKFTNRAAPIALPQDKVENIDVPLDLEARQCPDCNVPLVTTNETASTIDIPALPSREITFFHVEVGACPCCQHKARGGHPLLKPSQNGANAHQLGNRIITQALTLHYETGLPLRKVPRVIEALTGIALTQSALTQKACTLCDEGGLLTPHYEALRGDVAQSKVVNTDDTGWRVNTVLSFVMGFFTDTICFYQITPRHRKEEVAAVIGWNFQGILGGDRGPSYRAEEFNMVDMQKCLSHILKNLSEVEKTKTGRAKVFTSTLKVTLRETIDLWKEYKAGKIDEAEYRRRGKELDKTVEYQLRNRNLTDADNQRMLEGLGIEYDRGRLLLFLEHPEVEPTNNRAERGLRPAVIARKVSQCSKNERGARAYAMLKTIFGTLALRTKNSAAAFAALLEGQSMADACKR